jgi:hypothetical protein
MEDEVAEMVKDDTIFNLHMLLSNSHFATYI